MKLKPVVVCLIAVCAALSWGSASGGLADPVVPGVTAHNVRSYGAAGDGVRIDTDAFQHAIDSCAAGGGGTVAVPPGTYRIGTIVLKSNITLSLDAGATLLGSDRLADYRPFQRKPAEGVRATEGMGSDDNGPLHLIYAAQAQRVTLTGRGTIDGNGRVFWDENFQPRQRPQQMIQFEGCEDIRIEGVTLRNSPFWALNILSSDRARIDGITILNHRRGPNTDGIDISSSSNVFIAHCFINTGDDAICLKGPFRDEPTENITVTHCTLISDDSAVKLGTRSNGDIRNVIVSNCIIRDSNYGIALFMKDGGVFEDLLFSDIIIETADPRVRNRPVFPLFADLEKRDAASKAGTIRRVTFQRIAITSDGHSLLGGMPGYPLEAVTLQDIQVRIPRPAAFAAISKPRGVRGLASAGSDFSRIPSSITLGHVRGITLRNVSVEMGETAPGDERHTLYCLEVVGLTVDGLRAAGVSKTMPMIALDQSAEAYITGVRVPAEAPVFLALSGSATKDIVAVRNELSGASKLLRAGPEVDQGALRQSRDMLPDSGGK